VTDGWSVEIIGEFLLPDEGRTLRLRTLEDVARAIRTMQVRSAPLIGAAAAYGVGLAISHDPLPGYVRCRDRCARDNRAHRRQLPLGPGGAATLRRRVGRACVRGGGLPTRGGDLPARPLDRNQATGRHGLRLVRAALAAFPDRPVQLMTHCNAGWLGTVTGGTAIALVYQAREAGVPIHVWVSETQPRNQGAALTAWELGQSGVAHTVIADNAAGHLMQTSSVDLCVTGADRVAANGDVCSKIGTYLKTLVAADTGVPSYAAVSSLTIDGRARSAATSRSRSAVLTRSPRSPAAPRAALSRPSWSRPRNPPS
jgi:methylthioribose-1-phosphate isomerase